MRRTPAVVGQVVLITGAARGIGAGLARELAGRGATVALVGLEGSELSDVAAACGAAGVPAQAWEADVTDSDRLVAVTEEIRARWGRIDAVVANAGIATGGPVLDAHAESFDRVIEVNLLGQVRTARATLPCLVESRGYYLQMTSAAALLPAPSLAAYCASKSGAEAFAHALAGEVRHQGVRVGVAYLSWVDTDLVRGTDAHPRLRAGRAAMPWPLNTTYSLDAAVTALADGVARRRAHIMFPSWLWGAYAGRALAPVLAARLGPRLTRRAQQARAAERDGDRIRLIGPGGAADERARRPPAP